MKVTRLRAPSHDGGLLAAPSLDQAVALVDANARRAAAWEYDFQGRPARWLSSAVRRQAVEASREFLAEIGLSSPVSPGEGSGDLDDLVVTGHQPEMFHPGVWVKNFAAAGIAARRGSVALNLVIDDDIPKSASIRVPYREDGRLVVRRMEFDRWEGEAPYEDLPVRDEETFATFGVRVQEALDGLVEEPLVEDYWPEVARYRESGFPLGLRLAAARRRIESAWGIENLEVPFSRLCQTEGFQWFASHLLAHLPRFQAVHNQALREYRALYGIRSKNHPVSALKSEGDWLEAPFWVWRSGRPRRRPLMVRQDARTMHLRISGEPEPFLELPLAPDREACCAVERLMELRATDVRLRTRALTTTMFSRFLLSDLFIHGIGGAKYDELGDAIALRFFNAKPPAFLTLSLTSWMGLPESAGSPSALADLERELRGIEYNPDRYLLDRPTPEEAALITEKRLLQSEDPMDPGRRRDRFRRFRAINEALTARVTGRADELRSRRSRLQFEIEQNRLARSREYALVLHPKEHLRSRLMTLCQDVGATTEESL